MDILAYGEDALTLWAITHKLSAILQMLNDPSAQAKCQALFRPSFGRSGGESSSQFGEFDFILLAEQRLYLVESKWQRSSEKIHDGVLALRNEQLLRHILFKVYVEEWAFGQYANWREFKRAFSPNYSAGASPNLSHQQTACWLLIYKPCWALFRSTMPVCPKFRTCYCSCTLA